MKRPDTSIYPMGSFEYIVLHAKWRRSRGRRPSATLSFCDNPRKALAWAEDSARFPILGVYEAYLGGKIPEHYKCSKCGADNCKLWRGYQSLPVELLCAPCAAAEGEKDISLIDADGRYPGSIMGQKTDQIGWNVPAIPTEDTAYNAYWGYTSVPFVAVRWWRNLPTLPSPKAILEIA
jgi:hypothetical protein